jgi:hypothetical protein
MSTTTTKTFATGSVSVRTGTEGPRHDPYSFEEWVWERHGERTTLHLGLGEWLVTGGRNLDTRRICEITGRDDPRACQTEFEKITGVRLKVLERAMHRLKHCCDRPRIHSVDGFPGEELLVCGSCSKVVGGSFNEGAVI